MNNFSKVLAGAVLILLPLAGWVQTTATAAWRNRLAVPNLTGEPRRHTPLYHYGTFLPPVITRDTTIPPSAGPVLLAGTTRIAPGVSLFLPAGTRLYASEFSGLVVEGLLTVQGTKERPALLSSNEQHPLNQVWSGITVKKGGRAVITQTAIHFAAPALTCLPGSTASLDQSRIADTPTAIYSAAPGCEITRSRIHSTRYGIVAAGVKPKIEDTQFYAARGDIIKVPDLTIGR